MPLGPPGTYSPYYPRTQLPSQIYMEVVIPCHSTNLPSPPGAYLLHESFRRGMTRSVFAVCATRNFAA